MTNAKIKFIASNLALLVSVFILFQTHVITVVSK